MTDTLSLRIRSDHLRWVEVFGSTALANWHSTGLSAALRVTPRLR